MLRLISASPWCLRALRVFLRTLSPRRRSDTCFCRSGASAWPFVGHLPAHWVWVWSLLVWIVDDVAQVGTRVGQVAAPMKGEIEILPTGVPESVLTDLDDVGAGSRRDER